MALNRIQTEGIEDDAITTAKILDGTVGPADIGDGELTNTQINASAAIATSKLSGAVTGIASHGLGTAATLAVGTSATNVVQLDGSGNLPALNASALTNLDATDLSGTLPALNGSNLTNLDATDLSGNLPALNASALTNLDASDLTGALPAISGAALTGVTTDVSAIEANIAILGFKCAAAGNLAKFNLVDQVVDEYKDGTGVTVSTVSQVGDTALEGYLATVYSSDVVTTPSSASDWSVPSGASLSSFTFSSGRVLISSGDDSTDSDWTSGAGDFTVQYTMSGSTNMFLGVYANAEYSDRSDSNGGGLQNMTNSYWWADSTNPFTGSGAPGNNVMWKGNSSTAFIGGNHPADGSVVQFKRVGSVLTHVDDGTIIYQDNSANTGSFRFAVCSGGAPSGDITNLTLTAVSSSANATGTATSTANTALSAPTTADIVMLMENFAGTATLNTDLKVYVSRNGGSGWDQATLVDNGTWGTNKKILVANNVAFSNSASGTDMRYKIEWANQSAGSKETRVHATSLGWA